MSEARRRKKDKRLAIEQELRSPRVSSVADTQPFGFFRSFKESALSGRALWVSVGLIVCIIGVYAPITDYKFVGYDDPIYVTGNPGVTNGLTWHSVQWALTSGYAANWHPLTWVSHMLDVQLFGMNAGFHHLTSVILHIFNAILLFALLHYATKELWKSAFVAALFAVHPVHVESVAWIAERKDVLSTLFWLLTMCAYVGYVRQRSSLRYAIVLALFALGLMSKPMVVTLPFVLLLFDFWPLGRLSIRSALEKIPMVAMTVVSSVITFFVQRRGGAVLGLEEFSLGIRIANALKSYVAYIGKMLWPVRLAVIYPHPKSIPAWEVIAASLFLIGVSAVVILAARRYPYGPVGWMWYLGTLVPVIGVVQVGVQSMADRYTYIPLIGLFIVIAWGSADLLKRWTINKQLLPAAAAFVIVACIITTRTQLWYWESSTSLWEHALAVTQDNVVAHNGMGNLLMEQGKLDDAAVQYREALRIDANFVEAHNGLAAALASQGKIPESITHYSEAVRLNPNYPQARNNLGMVLSREKRFDEAVSQFQVALRINPDYAEAHNGLASALVSQGKLSEGINEYQAAIRVDPKYAAAHNNLGNVWLSQGKAADAIKEYSEAVRSNPNYVLGHVNLGLALADQGRLDEAIKETLEALRINPDNASTHYSVALLYNKNGNSAEAARHLQMALKIDPDYAEARAALDDIGKASGR